MQHNEKILGIIKKISDFLYEARGKYPCQVDREDITYGNGNDGTDFDWEANEHLCEFGWGIPSGEVWAFKCLVYNDGSATLYSYPNGEQRPVETMERQLFSADDAELLYEFLLSRADRRGLYDAGLSQILED